jgi:hypothetical protein
MIFFTENIQVIHLVIAGCNPDKVICPVGTEFLTYAIRIPCPNFVPTTSGLP